MTRVWEHSRHKGSALLLLLAIADHAHDDGSGAWPSVAHLARKVRMSERQVQRLIRVLSAGIVPELGLEEEAGPGRAHLFTVLLARDVTGDKMSPPSRARDVTLGVTRASARGDTAMSPGGDTAMSPKPSPTVREPSLKSSANDDDVTDEDAIADALDALHDLDDYPFDEARDRAMLTRVHERRPGVQLLDEFEAWMARGRAIGLHDQRAALEGWLLKAQDGPPRKRDPRCASPHCRGRGRGETQLCIVHLGLARERSSRNDASAVLA
jgi:hypothetical protein